MRSFWLWFLLLLLALLGAVAALSPAAEEWAWRMLFVSMLLAAYFVSPLFRMKPLVHALLLGACIVFAACALWPLEGQAASPYSLLVFSMLAGKSVYRLPPKSAAAVGVLAAIGALAPGFAGSSSLPLAFLGLYAAIFTAGLALYKATALERESALARNEALLSEYRQLKRNLLSMEEAARLEERTQIGRDIHDSVGHKLTALLMQLEVHRMGAEGEMRRVLDMLKGLAKESLEETRDAVRLLKAKEPGGLSALMGMVRRLEAESFMRIHFTIKDGAFTAPLSNAQSIAVYRAVQEALTNVMRHSKRREAHIVFEAPGGGSHFRFEVANPHEADGQPLSEGYGLKAMRERLAQVGGELEVLAYSHQFIVRGTVSMLPRGGNER